MKLRLTSGVLLIAAVAGTIGLSACTPAASSGPSTPTPSTSQTAPTTTSQTAPATSSKPAPTSQATQALAAQPKPATHGLPGVIEPSSYGKLTIGMTRSQAMATGMIQSSSWTTGDCTFHSFYPGVQATYGNYVVISDKYGVVDITPPPAAKVHTPAGVGIGSTIAQLKAAYPAVTQGGMGYEKFWTIPVPNTDNIYTFVVDAKTNRVNQTYLLKQHEDCVNS